MTTTPRSAPCKRIVIIGASPTPYVRCNEPENSIIHDPLGPPGRHVYDPAPVIEEK